MRLQRFLEYPKDWGINLKESGLRHTYCGQLFLLRYGSFNRSSAVGGGSRLQELKGRTEVMPSMVARDWKLGANGCRGASWSEDLATTPRSWA